jgi:hypothetical protein
MSRCFIDWVGNEHWERDSDDDGPQLVNQHYSMWYRNYKIPPAPPSGIAHRENGPAIIYKNSDLKLYYLDAEQYILKEYIDELIKRGKIKSEDALVCYLKWS